MSLTKRLVDSLTATGERYFLWDTTVRGFGVRVEATGRRTYVCRYRASGIRRQYTIGPHGVVTLEQARNEARRVLGNAYLGKDLSQQRNMDRSGLTLSNLVAQFLEMHGPKLKPSSLKDYENALRNHVIPELGRMRAESITSNDLNKIHLKLRDRPYRANRTLAYLGSVFSWAGKNGYLPKDFNPAADVGRFREEGRERFLTGEQLTQLGAVLHDAETVGLPWKITASSERRKHVPRSDPRIVYSTHVVAAIRLLLLTGCRLREILNLRWQEVDLERGLLLLSDSKTGRKPVMLNGAAAEVLRSLDRAGTYVILGNDLDKPRRDLKRPWDHIRAAANLDGVRLHDLRHTHASVGAGAGLGLQIVGRLLGQKSPLTTQRYAHLADDPVRRASETIGVYLSNKITPRSSSRGRD